MGGVVLHAKPGKSKRREVRYLHSGHTCHRIGAREWNLWVRTLVSFQVGITIRGFWGFPSLYLIVHMSTQLFSKQGNISTIEALDF